MPRQSFHNSPATKATKNYSYAVSAAKAEKDKIVSLFSYIQ
jgi:hypothetical protein